MAIYQIVRRSVESTRASESARSKRTLESVGGDDGADERAPSDGDTRASTLGDSLEAVAVYFPAEINGLYVVWTAAFAGVDASLSTKWATFWIFLIGCPVLVWFLAGLELQSRREPRPWSFRKLPIWPMIASMIGFSVWVFALPQGPFADKAHDWYSSDKAAAVLATATALMPLLSRAVEGSRRP